MKGGIACALAAVLDHLSHHGGKPKGSISFLITGDEEGIAVNGTPKLLKWAAERGEKFDHCILGEPSNQEELGDTIKIGRRGSLNGHLIVTGKQGHVAYPQRARKSDPRPGDADRGAAKRAARSRQRDNSRRRISSSPRSMSATRPSISFPARHARVSISASTTSTRSIRSKKLIEQRAAKAAGGKIAFTFQWEPSNAGVFVTKPGPFTELVANAVAEVTGRKPELSTTGGTSDARFITAFCPVVEFGLVGQTMHAIDERVPIADLRALTTIYRKIIDRYFSGTDCFCHARASGHPVNTDCSVSTGSRRLPRGRQ